ncbi:hypothetical protein TNCT_679661 [Trichonephila clavata]|uniref:Uncharacterized protein n=1 Tax=Trichonephila clavata TaxID=2740835 RepID=A0A8X6HF92_TRICU|nr:hypothetical protein TNCT_679661 [Trichonephila clavata]
MGCGDNAESNCTAISKMHYSRCIEHCREHPLDCSVIPFETSLRELVTEILGCAINYCIGPQTLCVWSEVPVCVGIPGTCIPHRIFARLRITQVT